MKYTKGYCCLIQYRPDPERMECANIGVVLYCPDTGFIEARMARGNDRVRKFFGSENVDDARLNIAKQTIENRLKVEKEKFYNLEYLIKFVQTRANEIRITEPRSTKILQSEEKTLRNLFNELVGEQ